MTTITCRIPEQLSAILKALAHQRRVPKSTIVREALEQWLKRERNDVSLTAYDLAKAVCGTLGGPSDLATNPKHMEGFGVSRTPIRNRSGNNPG